VLGGRRCLRPSAKTSSSVKGSSRRNADGSSTGITVPLSTSGAPLYCGVSDYFPTVIAFKGPYYVSVGPVDGVIAVHSTKAWVSNSSSLTHHDEE
jgi:hypothetical protein